MTDAALLSIRDAAALCPFSYTSLLRHIRAGRLKATRFSDSPNGRLYVLRSDLMSFLAHDTTPSNPLPAGIPAGYMASRPDAAAAYPH